MATKSSKSDSKVTKNSKNVHQTDKSVQKTDNESLVEYTLEYRNAMAREKLRRLILQNDHQQFDLDKKNESVCYRAIAMSEFEKAIASIDAQIQKAE